MTFRNTVARNIAAYRRKAGLTQSELAERLNYSDKSISKWERAEGMPDTETLAAMAKIFGITISELVGETEENSGAASAESAPDSAGRNDDPCRLARKDGENEEKRTAAPQRLTGTKIAVTLIAVASLWAICGITEFMFSVLSPSVAGVWNVRIAAYFGATSLLLWYIFAALWWGKAWRIAAMSAFVWSVAAALHVSFPSESIIYIYAVAAVFQVIIICAAAIKTES